MEKAALRVPKFMKEPQNGDDDANSRKDERAETVWKEPSKAEKVTYHGRRK